jgi:hypothetical protein
MIRLSFLLSAAMLLSAPLGFAQTYETGSQQFGEPRSSAQFGTNDAADFTMLSPAQIAADVTTAYNPRTGAKELVAPTFDPFEDDETLAGSVKLRGTAGARDLDGNVVTDGALLEISLFYTDAGDRRFGLTRDAVFLSGDPVPTILRDSRELECSSRVTERVYQYDRYDDRNAARHIWIRPDYRGHRGFTYGGFGAGWGGYGAVRPRGLYNRRFNRRPHPRNDIRGPVRGHPGTTPDVGRDRDRTPPTPYYPQTDRRLDGDVIIRPRPRGVTPPTTRPRSNRNRSDAARDIPQTTIAPRPTIAPDIGRPAPRVQYRGGPARTERRDMRPVPPNRDRAEPRSEPRVTPPAAPQPAPRVDTRPAPRAENRPIPTSRPTTIPRPAPAPTRAAPTRQQNRSTRGELNRIKHDMFPGDGFADAIVVQSQRDCAREDQLSFFIPNDRLEAARFDGLTLILRDVTFDPKTGQTTVYEERPLYIPPNYIDGFRLALSQS